MRRTLVLAALLTAAAVLLTAPAHADGCARYAATAGSDASAGTSAAPYRSLQKLVAALQPGQAGCLVGDVYDATEANGIFRTSPASSLKEFSR